MSSAVETQTTPDQKAPETESNVPPQKPKRPDNSGGRASNPLTSGRLPGWAVWAILGGSIAVAAIIMGLVSMAAGNEYNWAGFVVLAGIINLVAVYVITRIAEGGRQATDRFMTALVSSAFVIALFPLLSLVITLFGRGMERFDAEFFSSSMQGIVSQGGGAVHAIWGTVLITLVATLISVPIGIFTSIYLVEYGSGWLAKAINFFVDVMTGIPSIVAGLFAFTMVFAAVNAAGGSPVAARTGMVGAIALSVLMIPTVVRSTEEMLRLVPMELREASYALGVPKWLTIVKVVLPTALAGITTGVTLAIARVIGESAPLLLTAGIARSLNTNLFSQQMMSLPVFVYQMTQGTGPAQQPWEQMAWTAALVLLIIVMALNLIARLIARFFAPKSGR